jgi:hypothetical protein
MLLSEVVSIRVAFAYLYTYETLDPLNYQPMNILLVFFPSFFAKLTGCAQSMLSLPRFKCHCTMLTRNMSYDGKINDNNAH